MLPRTFLLITTPINSKIALATLRKPPPTIFNPFLFLTHSLTQPPYGRLRYKHLVPRGQTHTWPAPRARFIQLQAPPHRLRLARPPTPR